MDIGRRLAAAALLMGLAVATMTTTSWAQAKAARPAPVAIPFALDTRPVPSGRSPELLLPRQVGGFSRRPFPNGTRIEGTADLNADYTDGRDTVNVGLSVTERSEDAQAAIRTLKGEALEFARRRSKGGPMPLATESIGTDPSFYRIGEMMGWSRGGYFYYARASSEAGLNRFMEEFPF